ncbi:MAG TPA: malto-oligosyltrehalose synthase [Acidimicrobiales bacterium]|nr:malto-oligosyltrehalose synthase [Acidimicrobiales bacterium]
MNATADERRAASTYRLQLTPSFGFAAAASVVPYLAALGITDVYLSPIFEARPGSTHGYDVVDPTRVRAELGGDDGFAHLRDTVDAAGLRLLVDIVPNHMAAADANRWWRDPAYAYVFDRDRETGRYRRFFDYDELAAVRQEEPRVFQLTHRRIAELAVEGMRVDHVDGLRDPRGYLERLRAMAPERYVVVEKILEGDEALPRTWPVAGTTGYEFASRVLGLFVDPAALPALDALYVDLTGDRRTWSDAVRAGKAHALDAGLRQDVARVARAFGDASLADVIRALAIEWPVYRTYTRRGDVSPADVAVIEATCARVRTLMPDRVDAIDRVERALLRVGGGDEGADRFQMLTGPAMAKGVEDRAFYDYTRFVALNEVGGNPDAFGVSVAEWHAACARAAELHPAGMLTTATHDTKRGEDVRARLAAITARPGWWADHAAKWMVSHDGIDGPTAYLLLQTVVGAWPINEERLAAYMRKAVREAGTHTSWGEPDDAYERAVDAAARAAASDAALPELVESLAPAGNVNALAQTLLRLTAPGVPDTYQGTEFWDLSLVDPDNRRPVDFDLRARTLASRGGDGWAKMAVIAAALEARRAFPQAFAGAYRPIESDEGVVAFARGDDVVVVVPVRPGADVARVALPAGGWTNRLEGSPVALFTR